MSEKFRHHHDLHRGNQLPNAFLGGPYIYNNILDLLEKDSTDQKKHPLIQKGEHARLNKLSLHYDKSFPLVMTATFVDPRCKMNFFWSTSGMLVQS